MSLVLPVLNYGLSNTDSSIQFQNRLPELLSQVSLLVFLSLCSLLLFLHLLLYFDTNLFSILLRIASTFRSLHIYNFYNLICSCLLNYIYLSFFLFLYYSLYYFIDLLLFR